MTYPHAMSKRTYAQTWLAAMARAAAAGTGAGFAAQLADPSISSAALAAAGGAAALPDVLTLVGKAYELLGDSNRERWWNEVVKAFDGEDLRDIIVQRMTQLQRRPLLSR